MKQYLKQGSYIVAAGALLASSPAFAADQMTILIGYGFGGTYGKYARTMADHLRKQIPGSPNIVVQSMPGAGGLKATNYAAKVMPSNGNYLLEPPDTLVISQLMRPKKVKYDARKFTWIGSVNRTNTIFVLHNKAGIKRWQDMRTKGVITGGTGPGSTSYMIPQMLKNMLGLKVKVISGYKGSRKTVLAMEQGEHHGTGFNWLAWSSIAPHWFSQKYGGTAEPGQEQAVPLLQIGTSPDPSLPDVPMMTDYVKGIDLKIVNFISSHGIIGRGLAYPPGVAKSKVAPLRAQYAKMAKDPKFVSDANKRRLRVIYSSGQQIQDVVNSAFRDAEPTVVKAAAKIVFGK
jgi:tripartite-type tricarboxylate transporter receptor subunit TctC